MQSFQQLTVVVRLVSKSKHGRIDPSELGAALKAHGDAFKHAYGGRGVKPKFHYARKLEHQLRRDNTLLDTFVCERKHSLVEQAAHATDNTKVFERTVLCRAFALQVGQLKKTRLRDGLLHGQPCADVALQLGADRAEVSTRLVFDGTTYGAKDVIFVGGSAAEIVCGVAARVGDTFHFGVLVHTCVFERRVTSIACRWRLCANLHFVQFRVGVQITLSPLWAVEPDGALLILD